MKSKPNKTCTPKTKHFIAAVLLSSFFLFNLFAFAAMGKPMKVMKKVMKSTPAKGKPTSGKRQPTSAKGKPTPAKGKPTPAKGKPLKKGAAQGILKKNTLQKLGQLSLQDKIKKIAETHDDEHEAAKELQGAMTPAEKSRTWSKHQTHLNKDGNEEEKDAFDKASKNEKGELTALFLMRKEAAKFCNVSRSISTKQEMTFTEKWLSEKEALEKWGDDLEKHCTSGRVQWRQCKTTWGVYEYMDTEDYKTTTTGTAKRSWTQGQEFQQNEDEYESWDNFLEKELHSLIMDQTPGKGKGKGKVSQKKGKGRGKGDSNQEPPKALEDLPPDEQQVECIKKLKKTRDLVQQCMANYEEALEKVKAMKYLSKPALKDKEAQLSKLEATLGKVKTQLGKGDKGKVSITKDVLKEAVATMSEAKEEAKELVQISMKTQSKSSRR